MPTTAALEGSSLALFLRQSIKTFCNNGRYGISLARQKTLSTQSQLMPRLMNLLSKRFFQMLVYRVRPATAESPIMMKLKFSNLT